MHTNFMHGFVDLPVFALVRLYDRFIFLLQKKVSVKNLFHHSVNMQLVSDYF